MKKMPTVSIMLILFLGITFAQQQAKFGLGFEFHTFPSVFMMEESGSAMGIYVPIETGSLLIEPQISYYSYSSETDYDDYDDYNSSTTIWSLTAGVFKPFVKGDIRSYAGVRVGKTWSVYEETDQDDDEDDAFILAPTIGAEYFISENFSFGGEGMYSMISSEDKEDTYTRTTKLTTIIPTFIVRFYF